MAGDRHRGRLDAVVWIVLGAILAAVLGGVATVAWWERTVLADEDVFVAHAVDVLSSETGRRALASEIVDRIAADQPLLTFFRGPAVRAVAGVLAAPVFEPLYEAAATDLHDGLMHGGAVVIDLGRWRETILAPLAEVSPELAAAVPDSVFAPIVVAGPGTLPHLPGVTAVTAVLAGASVLLVLLLVWLVRVAAFGATVAAGAGATGAGILALVTAANAGRRAVGGVAPGPRHDVAAMLAAHLTSTLRLAGRLEIAGGILILAIVAALAILTRGEEPSDAGE